MVYYMVANIVLLIVAGRVIYCWNSTTIVDARLFEPLNWHLTPN